MVVGAVRASSSSELNHMRLQWSSQPAENKLRVDEGLMTRAMSGLLMIPRINLKKLIPLRRGSADVLRQGHRDSQARPNHLLQLSTARVKFQGLIH